MQVKVVLTWTWRHQVTRLEKVRIGRYPHDMRLTFRCTGRGCPRVALASAAGPRRVRRLLHAWEGRRFRAGARLFVTLKAPHYLSEKAVLIMRVANEPRVRSL